MDLCNTEPREQREGKHRTQRKLKGKGFFGSFDWTVAELVTICENLEIEFSIFWP